MKRKNPIDWDDFVSKLFVTFVIMGFLASIITSDMRLGFKVILIIIFTGIGILAVLFGTPTDYSP